MNIHEIFQIWNHDERYSHLRSINIIDIYNEYPQYISSILDYVRYEIKININIISIPDYMDTYIVTREFIWILCKIGWPYPCSYNNPKGKSFEESIKLCSYILQRFRGNQIKMMKGFINQKQIYWIEAFIKINPSLNKYVTLDYIYYMHNRYSYLLKVLVSPKLLKRFTQKYLYQILKSRNITTIKAIIPHIDTTNSYVLRLALQILYKFNVKYCYENVLTYNSIISLILSRKIFLDEDVLNLVSPLLLYSPYSFNICECILPNYNYIMCESRSIHVNWERGISSKMALLLRIAYGNKSQIPDSILNDYSIEIYYAFRTKNKFMINIREWLLPYVWINYGQYIYMFNILPRDIHNIIVSNLFC